MRDVASARPELRTHVHPGIRVFDVHRCRVDTVTDLYDETRSARMRGRDGVRFTITYAELMREYRCIQPFAEGMH